MKRRYKYGQEERYRLIERESGQKKRKKERKKERRGDKESEH